MNGFTLILKLSNINFQISFTIEFECIIWQFEIEECSKLAGDSFPAELEYFKIRRETLNLIYAVKKSNCNCYIWLTDTIEDPCDYYMDIDNRAFLSSILFD